MAAFVQLSRSSSSALERDVTGLPGIPSQQSGSQFNERSRSTMQMDVLT